MFPVRPQLSVLEILLGLTPDVTVPLAFGHEDDCSSVTLIRRCQASSAKYETWTAKLENTPVLSTAQNIRLVDLSFSVHC
jgi:hypothetical protein